MLKFLTNKNKIKITLHIIITILLLTIFLLITHYSFNSFINYKNQTILKIYDQKTNPLKFDSTSITKQVIFIIIDGLSYEDFYFFSSLNEFKNKAFFTKLKILEPTLSITSWMTFLTGATPEIHGFISPLSNSKPKYQPCENIISIAHSRTLTTAVFGHIDWSIFKDFIDYYYFASFREDNSNLISIDEEIITNAISYIKNQKPNLTLVHLPGLDKTLHLYGKQGPEFKIHIQKLDNILNSFLKNILVNNRYVIITSDHGHIAKGGHGGSEPSVINSFFMIAGPTVNQNISNIVINQIDICPMVCLLLGIPTPYLNEGTFISELFNFDDNLKFLKLKSILYQKSFFVKNYILNFTPKIPNWFDFEVFSDEFSADKYDIMKLLTEYKNYEINLTSEFKNFKQQINDKRKIYRSFYFMLVVAIILVVIIKSFKNTNPQILFYSILSTIIFYGIYYSIYFMRGFNFSLSDFNDYAYFKSFMNLRKIEIIISLILAICPIIFTIFTSYKKIRAWFNIIFLPFYFNFNIFLLSTLILQCAWYVLNYGLSFYDTLPNMSSAVKFYFDLQIIITLQIFLIFILFLFSFITLIINKTYNQKGDLTL